MEQRRPRLVAYASQLQAALLDPSLPLRTRQKYETRLANIKADLQGRPRK
jgi:hypothetical protein